MAYEPNEWGEWAGRENLVYKLRRLEEGLAELSWGANPVDIAAAVENYLTANPPMGINPAELEGAILSYLTLNPPKAEFDESEIAAAVSLYLDENPPTPKILTRVITGANSNGTVSLSAAFKIVAVQYSGAARLRLYRTAAGRAADAHRDFTTTPPNNVTLLYDFLALGATTDNEAPVLGAGEAGSRNIFYRIDHGPATITLQWVRTGAS